MNNVQQRVLSLWPDLEVSKASALLRRMRGVCNRAIEADKLAVAQQDLHKYITLEEDKQKGQSVVRGGLLGGQKPFARLPESALLRRDDDAWLHFTVTLSQAADRLELLAYDFELVFPANHSPPWIRFDLNYPEHSNQARDLRSHLHPGNDDILLPAPIMTPVELLELLIVGCRPRDPTKPRAP